MRRAALALAYLSLLLSGAIFGFFFAWVSSTMWGLDAADPRTAIAAMQAMNASVRNAVFAPVFFGPPVALVLTGVLAWRLRRGRATLLFLLAGAIYLVGGFGLTLAVNVPMNEALAQMRVPSDAAGAAEIWAAYSPRWQLWNQIRTGASGVTLLLAAMGLRAL